MWLQVLAQLLAADASKPAARRARLTVRFAAAHVQQSRGLAATAATDEAQAQFVAVLEAALAQLQTLHLVRTSGNVL